MEYYASVCHVNETTVTYHSGAAVPASEPKSTRFWNVLRSFENQSLWRHLSCDGDGEWIHRGMLMGSLCIVHDGSYMVDLDSEVCSAGLVMFCKISRQTLKCAVAERSAEAGNYRGEILGGIICQLILRAASRRKTSPYRAVAIHCDNKGVIYHGKDRLGHFWTARHRQMHSGP